MAKWEERDPRWIVEERPDATNVNNWHWSDKNASHWSKNKFADLFRGLKIEADFGYCEITEVLKCEGDAVVYNRKGMFKFFYEWNLEMKWNGVVYGGSATGQGRVSVCCFTEIEDVKDVDILIDIENNGEESSILKHLMQSTGKRIIQKQLTAYITALKEDFTKGFLLPTPDSSDVEMISVAKVSTMWKLNEYDVSTEITESNCKTSDIISVETFKCTAEEFYHVLTDKDFVQAFTHSHCDLQVEEGGKFSLFGGNVGGFFVKLQPFELIILKWRCASWPNDHYSDVIIAIEQKTDCTEVKLSQYGIPEEELENTRVGWQRYYWESIKQTFGFGAELL